MLFGGSAALRKEVLAAVASAPSADGPLDAVAAGLAAAGELIGSGRRDLVRLRQAVIAANPGLAERELAKLADIAGGIAAALRQRGVPEPRATVAAEVGVAVLRVAMQQWIDQDDGDGSTLVTLIEAALAEARAMAISPARRPNR